jgi:hypothetical protein
MYTAETRARFLHAMLLDLINGTRLIRSPLYNLTEKLRYYTEMHRFPKKYEPKKNKLVVNDVRELFEWALEDINEYAWDYDPITSEVIKEFIINSLRKLEETSLEDED